MIQFKKDLLILCEYFYPDLAATSKLMTELAEDLVRSGLSVDAYCSYPSYVQNKSNVEGLTKKEIFKGIQIRRFQNPHFNKNTKIGRILNYFSFSFFIFINIFSLRNYRMILLLSNPPLLPIFGYISKKLFRNKYFYLIHDLYPNNAIAIGTIKNENIVAKVMRFVNNRAFNDAELIIVLGEDVKRYLCSVYETAQENKVIVIPNWADKEKIQIKDKKNPVSIKMEFDNKFIVMYTGNLGILQDLELVIECAAMIKDMDDILFVFVGEGAKKQKLIKMTEEHNLKNVKFIEFKEGEEYVETLAFADCFILTLEKCAEGLAVPSKSYTYMAAGKPIIGIISKDTDIGKIIEKENIGCRIDYGDVESLSDRIRFLYENSSTCKQLGNNARALFESNFERKRITPLYCEIVKKHM